MHSLRVAAREVEVVGSVQMAPGVAVAAVVSARPEDAPESFGEVLQVAAGSGVKPAGKTPVKAEAEQSRSARVPDGRGVGGKKARAGKEVAGDGETAEVAAAAPVSQEQAVAPMSVAVAVAVVSPAKAVPEGAQGKASQGQSVGPAKHGITASAAAQEVSEADGTQDAIVVPVVAAAGHAAGVGDAVRAAEVVVTAAHGSGPIAGATLPASSAGLPAVLPASQAVAGKAEHPAGSPASVAESAAAAPFEPAEMRMLPSEAGVLEIGLPAGAHGWVRVRAEMDAGSGEVAATLFAGSAHTAQGLQLELPAMQTYLASEQIALRPVVVEAASSGLDAQAQGDAQRGAQDGGSQAATLLPGDAEEAKSGWLPGFGMGSGGWLSVLA